MTPYEKLVEDVRSLRDDYMKIAKSAVVSVDPADVTASLSKILRQDKERRKKDGS